MEMLKKIESLEQEKFRANQWLNESIEKESRTNPNVRIWNGRMEYGRLYQFKYYDPKTRDRLAYWNTNPLVIKIDEIASKEEGILDVGINLNFFPDQVKRQFIDVYWNRYKGLYEATTQKLRSPDEQREVRFNPDGFMRAFKSYGIGFCTRRYIFKRMDDIKVFSNDMESWAQAMLIKYPRFNGIGVTTRDKMFSEYINKTR